jgi:ElaB/YqjD/DUF883 family membrane-anchored ribosome-binding protein
MNVKTDTLALSGAESIKNAAAATEQYVKENPWKSMGFVTAASIGISLLVIGASVASMWRTLGEKK